MTFLARVLARWRDATPAGTERAWWTGDAYGGPARRDADPGATTGDVEPSGPGRRLRAAAMSAIWIGTFLVACCVALIAALVSWRRRVERNDFGTVSERWLAEQRNDHYSPER
jgi:hypothetical protein